MTDRSMMELWLVRSHPPKGMNDMVDVLLSLITKNSQELNSADAVLTSRTLLTITLRD